ncbi:hypothetical protein [Leptolyngbya sp. FACHB-261]|nr:hypothetical protein [Leptolyngbya sp. FACHB-261]
MDQQKNTVSSDPLYGPLQPNPNALPISLNFSGAVQQILSLF